MAKPKRASDDYINFRKKFTAKDKIKAIKALSKEWLLTPQEVCEKLIFDGLAREQKKLSA